MKAVILAAGKATRLRPVTLTMPKALVPVANKTLIGYAIDVLKGAGFHDIGIVVNDLDSPWGKDDVKAFSGEIKKLTGGQGMHIVCDLLRGPVFEAGIAAASRAGVNISAGWQLGTMVKYNSAGASTKQLTLDHTHYDTIAGVEAATALYGSVFRPTVHREIYAFDDLPRAISEMQANTQTGIPIIRVAKDMPASVKALVR